MVKVGFYCMNQKGFKVLEDFLSRFDSNNILYVVSARDANIQKDYYTEIQQLCNRNDINFYDKSQAKTNLFHKHYKFAIGWRWIIKESTNLIVLHDSMLPKYRGFAPLVNMLINGEQLLGVTALVASEEYDKGNIIHQKSVEITYPLKIHEAINIVSTLYGEIIIEIFMNIQESQLSNTIQEESIASYSSWLDEEDYYIDWSWSSEKIKRFIDATGFPYDCAKTLSKNNIYRIINAKLEADVMVENRERHIGKVIFFKDQQPIVICGEGLLRLNEINDMENKEVSIKFRTRFLNV